MQKKDQLRLVTDLKKAITGKEKEFGDRVGRVLSGFKLISLFVANLLLNEILWLTRMGHKESWTKASELIPMWRKEISPGWTVWKSLTNDLDEKFKEIEENGCGSVSLNRLALWIGWCLFCKYLRDELPEDYNVYSILEEHFQTAEEFLPSTMWGDLLVVSTKDLSDDARVEAAMRLYAKLFSRPIHKNRWKSLKLRSGELTVQRILASIFSLPSAIYKVKKRHWWEEAKQLKLGDLPLAELEPRILKAAMAKLVTDDLAGPGWRQIGRGLGELEIAATLQSKACEEWFSNEINEMNAELYLDTKIKAAKLTRGEAELAKSALRETKPPGMTDQAFRQAKSRLCKKINKI